MKVTSSPRLNSLCVFCGASTGVDPGHREAAAALGRRLGESGITLVFGGGHLGLMGVLADAVLGAGGRAVGIIPEHLMRVEAASENLTELLVVDSMHTRKRKMFDMADAFCALPGGFGTLDETFEILTWKQLRLHSKPVIICNIGGYWDPWVRMTEHIIGEGFARPETKALFSVVDNVDAVVPAALAAMKIEADGRSQLF